MVDTNLQWIEIAGFFRSFKDHGEVETLASIGQIDDPIGFFHLDPVSDRCHIGSVIVIAAIRLLDDHRQRGVIAAGKPSRKMHLAPSEIVISPFLSNSLTMSARYGL